MGRKLFGFDSAWVLALWGGVFFACTPTAARADAVPHLDHIIVVMMENHSYDQVRVLPYTSTLISSGSSFSSSYALTHPSQPNYIMFWSGASQGVTNDNCPAPGSPFTTENLGHTIESAGLTWKAYSEDLPAAGSTVCSANSSMYARKHAPWTQFSNLDHLNERPYSEFALAESLGTLPNLAFVVPNQCNDQHSCSLATGDTWLSHNIPAMVQAVGARGMVILTYDEDDHSSGNQILTCFVGPPVRSNYVSSTSITHYSVLRTICDALGIPAFAGAASASPITDVWAPTPVQPRSWSKVKGLYR